MSGWTLTVRDGPRVERERFETLAAAVITMRARAQGIRAAGGLPSAAGLRDDYQPGQRVKARLEISAGGWLRGRDAGVDVMGDGALVPYAGSFRRRRLEATADGDEFDAVRDALA